MKTDTLTLATVTPAQANAAVATIVRHSLGRADLLKLLEIVAPAPFGCDVPDAPHSARPRYGL